jgi:hypothetical protein
MPVCTGDAQRLRQLDDHLRHLDVGERGVDRRRVVVHQTTARPTR